MTIPFLLNPRPVRVTGYPGASLMEPFVTRDEKYMLFNSGEPNKRIYYATKISDTEFAFGGEIAAVNTSQTQGGPSMDLAGYLYFSTDRSLGNDHRGIYRGFWGWGIAPVDGLLKGPDGWYNMDGEISPDGNLFVFSDNNLGDGPMVSTLAMAAKNPDGSFMRLPDVMQNINVPSAVSYAPSLAVDRLELFLTQLMPNGVAQLFTATRPSVDAMFSVPEHIEAAAGFVEGPNITYDGHRLYYHCCVPGGPCVIMLLTR